LMPGRLEYAADYCAASARARLALAPAAGNAAPAVALVATRLGRVGLLVGRHPHLEVRPCEAELGEHVRFELAPASVVAVEVDVERDGPGQRGQLPRCRGRE